MLNRAASLKDPLRLQRLMPVLQDSPKVQKSLRASA